MKSKRVLQARDRSISILLTATALLLLQVPGGGELTATEPNEAMSEAPASAPAADSTAAELVNLRNAHTRVWEVAREVETTLPDGRTAVETVKSRICEKASGLCYKDATGEWVPSVPEWRETPDGFVIDRCGYGLFVGKTVGAGVRYTIGGYEVPFRPARLAISDGVNQLEAETLTPESPGFIVPGSPSILRFPAAFGPGYDLEYVAEKDGFHQNLVIWAAPSEPPGIAPDSCQFEIWTEVSLDSYLSAANAEIMVGLQRAADIDALAGVRVAAGTPIVFAPKADTQAEPEAGPEDPFWLLADSEVWDSSDPPSPGSRTAAVKEIRRDPETGTVYLIETLPVAYFGGAACPVTWDWVVKSGTIGSGVTEEWTPNNTYYVSGGLSIYGRVTILPGTVVKLAPNTYINVIGTQPFTAKGEPYNYIVFTNAKDDTCGERIDSAQTGRYATGVVLYSSSSAASVVQYCKFGHGTTGINVNKALTSPVANNIVRDMTYAGISLSQQTHCRNNLLVGTGTGAGSGVRLTSPAGYLDIKNNTIDSWQYGVYSYGCYGLTAKYNVVTRTYTGMYSNNAYLYIQYNGFWSYTVRTSGGTYGAGNVDLGNTPGYNPFDSSPVGDFFLKDNNPGGGSFKEAGDVQASQVGLASAEFAVVKPNVAPQSVTGNIYWVPVANDSGNLDFGYHHNRVDWVLDGADTTVSWSGLTLESVVVAIHGQGITLRVGTEGKIISLGDPYERGPNIIASKRSVSMGIESSLKLYPVYGQNESQVGITLSADSIFDSRIRHTIFRGLAWGVKAQRWCLFPIKHCRFDQNIIGMETYGGAVSAMNNVFAWNETGMGAALPTGGRAEFRNNTFDGNWWEGLHLNTVSGSTAIIKDNLFTSNNCGIQVYGAGDIQYGHNGFYGNTTPEPQPYPKEGDVFLASSPYYKQGVITKRWFLDQSTALKNGGSTTTVAAKLLPYVTAYNQSYDVGSIDIGFHAFTATGPATPDPDAPAVEVTEILGWDCPDYPGWKIGGISVTLDITEDNEYSCRQVQVYVDGEFAGSAAVGDAQTPPEEPDPPGELPQTLAGSCGIDTTLLPNGMHTAQALSENLKPATGASDPAPFKTYNYVHSVSMSRGTCNFVAGDTLEVSALVYPWSNNPGSTHWVQFTTIPFDPPGEDPYYFCVDELGPYWRPQTVKWFPPHYSWVVHEEWDGTLSPGIVEDDFVHMEIHAERPGGGADSSQPLAVSSTDIAEAEVGIFLPEVFFWDRITAQAVVNAAKRLKLPFRVFLKEEANWCNMATFLTAEREGEGPERPHPSVLYVAAHGSYIERCKDDYGQCRQYQVTHFVLDDAVVFATTDPGQDYGGELPAWFRANGGNKFIYDPIGDAGLEDPWGYGLYESGWVKFVWVDACYSHCDWGGSMCDMGRALGMMSDENIENQDQSYIGFANQTPCDWYDGWLMAAYAWLFWDFLSIVNDAGDGPAYGTENARGFTADVISAWANTWPWAAPLLYLVAINRISEPALYAMLRDHLP